MPTGAVPFTAAVEGPVDEVALRRIAESVGTDVGTVYVAEGKGKLVKRLLGFNAAAQYAPWIVLIDLNSAECAPALLTAILPDPSGGMTCRVAVRAIEAWLLGDAEHLAAFLGVAPSRLPADPDALPDPKQTLVNLAAASRRRAIREDITPRLGSRRAVGPNYAGRLIEFITNEEVGWRPAVAADRSDSLARALRAIAM